MRHFERCKDHPRPTASGAIVAFRLRPQSGAHPPFLGATRKGRLGSSLCENSSAFSHGPILFAFSSPQTAWKRKNRGKFRSARLFAKIRWVFARPRSRTVQHRGNCDRLRRADSSPSGAAPGRTGVGAITANSIASAKRASPPAGRPIQLHASARDCATGTSPFRTGREPTTKLTIGRRWEAGQVLSAAGLTELAM